MQMKGNPQQGLFGATLGFFAGFAAVSLFGPTAAKFKDLMGLTPVMVGFLVAIPSLSGSLLRIPFGAWVDTTGGRKPFLILLWLSVLGMLGLTGVVYFLYPGGLTASLYPLLLLLGVLSGCGIATFSVGIGQVSYWFPQKKQGSALGTYAGVGNLAPGLFSFLLPVVLASAWGLTGAYIAWLVFLVLGTVVYQFTGLNAWFFQARQQGKPVDEARKEAQSRGEELFPKGNARESLVNAARISQTWLLVIIYFTTFGGFLAMTSWLPIYWTSFYGINAVTAGSLSAFYSLTASVLRVAGGSISDKIGGERTAILSLGVTLVGAVLMTVSHSYELSIAGEFIMAVGMGVCNAAVFKLMPQYVPQAVGGASGWVGGLGAFGGFAIPPILGYFVRVAGDNGYATGFATYIVLTLLSLAVAFVLSRPTILKKVPAPQKAS
jgi:NNP family nitrate/nitrite transporter-like MFS transporter